MPTKGRSHFDSYTEQNRAKHAILAKYFGAYLKALSQTADAFHYIDGFAGPGRYGADHSGSPLYALELLVEQRKPATASFVENDPALFAELEMSVGHSAAYSSLIEPPLLRRGEFSDCLDEILHREVLRRFRKVATFAFVDPCGLTGLYMADLGKMLSLPFGECLVFLNYDGLNRWLGGVVAATHARDKLDRFFGSTHAVEAAIECVQSNLAGSLREQRLLDLYLQTVRLQSGARFVLPFRFRAPGRERTSHYLIHLSQHPLAFTIMKAVMRSESSATDDIGSFGFIPADELADQGQLFRPNAERARTEVLEELRHGNRPVSLFATQWPQRPGDMLVSAEYKRLLLDLEGEGLVEIVDPSTGAVLRATDRPKRSGEPTLGDRYFVRLGKREPI